MGDLDGDGDNDFSDFRLFQTDYIAANGEAAFAALMNIPEPTTAILAFWMFAAATLRLRRRCHFADFALAPPVRNGVQVVVLAATTAMCCGLPVSPAEAALRHRYTFNEGAAADASGRTIIDSISGANGIVRGAGSSATANQLVLSGGFSNTAAYVDLPNGIISTLTDATFEAWYTIDSTENWSRIFDFGSTTGGTNGELTGPGGDFGFGADFIFYAPMRGMNIDTQRVGVQNNDPLFGPGGSPGIVGDVQYIVDPEFNHAFDVQYHVALVFDADGGNDLDEASVTLYINGALPPGEDANPLETVVQLKNLNDVNNWLGRSNWTDDSNFDGSFNEFRIYNTALTADQVAANTAAGPDVVPVFEVISLEVDTLTGSVRITSNVETSVNLDYYTITSEEGALDAAGWSSLADQNRDAIGPGQGESWDEADQSNEFQLAELFLLGASGVSSTSPLELGRAFDVSAFGPGVNGDLEFRYAKQGSDALLNGIVSYVMSQPLAGDYNRNGTVDAADYVIWRKTLGSDTELDADGDRDGTVDQDDYIVWRSTFGSTATAARALQTTPVPEPTLASLLVAATLSTIGWRWTAALVVVRRSSLFSPYDRPTSFTGALYQ
jgi:hypothetical protein